MEEVQQQDISSGYENNFLWKMQEIENRQRLLQEKTMLLGQNLIELKEKNQKDLLEIKKDIEILNQTMERIKSFLEMASKEFSKFATKEEVELLKKQIKMFQP